MRRVFLSMCCPVLALLCLPQVQGAVVVSPPPARTVAPARTSAVPAGAARPAKTARPVPGYQPAAARRGAPVPPPPRPVDTRPVRVNGDLVVARTHDGRPVPILTPPRITIISSPASRRLVASGLHDTGSPAHVATCPECRALVDRETLRHLDAWWVGEQSRRMNDRLNRIYAPPPPPPHRKANKKHR